MVRYEVKPVKVRSEGIDRRERDSASTLFGVFKKVKKGDLGGPPFLLFTYATIPLSWPLP